MIVAIMYLKSRPKLPARMDLRASIRESSEPSPLPLSKPSAKLETNRTPTSVAIEHSKEGERGESLHAEGGDDKYTKIKEEIESMVKDGGEEKSSMDACIRYRLERKGSRMLGRP